MTAKTWILSVEWQKGGLQMTDLLERIVGKQADGHGTCLIGTPVHDASWTFRSETQAQSAKTRLISRGYRRVHLFPC